MNYRSVQGIELVERAGQFVNLACIYSHFTNGEKHFDAACS